MGYPVSGTEPRQDDRKTDRVIPINVCKSPCFRPPADTHSHILFLNVKNFPTILAVLGGGGCWFIDECVELCHRGLGEKIGGCERDVNRREI